MIHAIAQGMAEVLFMSFITVIRKRLNMGPLEITGIKRIL
jgi:hypothetical protein